MNQPSNRNTLLSGLALLLAIAGCDCGSGPDPMMDGDVPQPDTPEGTDAFELGDPLAPGLLATHLDLVDNAGTLVFTGYSPGIPPNTSYGDLVVGVYDSGSDEVTWEIVDGVPDGPMTRDPSGWRGGILAAGDDVGRFSSAVADAGTIHVAYYDRTNGALKFASGTPGGTWATHTVDDEGTAGRHASLVRTSSGVAVAYQGILPATMTPGRPLAEVRVAVAGAAPAGPTAWTITDVVSQEVDCRPDYCPEGSVCTEAGTCMMESGDCGADGCGDSEACIAGSCEPILEDDFVEDRPPFVGESTALASTSAGLGLVYYDRSSGDVFGAAFDGSAWGTPFLIDGYNAPPMVGMDPAGDSGLAASLAVDAAGGWHVTYVDGAEETLRYSMVMDGAVVSREIVDDGSTDGTDLHPDGRHVVGADGEVVVTASGELRVCYQDLTAQRTIFARKPVDGEWAISILDDQDSNGYFTNQVVVGGSSFVGAFWRQETRGSEGNGVRVYTVD